MQHAASHTTAVQPSSHNQRHVLIGKQWYQLPELIPTNSNSKPVKHDCKIQGLSRICNNPVLMQHLMTS